MPLPTFIPSIRPLKDEQIRADVEWIIQNQTRLDQLRARTNFVTTESRNFLRYATQSSFCLQQALNYADAGPVVDVAERLFHVGVRAPLILHHRGRRAAYNLHFSLLRILDGPPGTVMSVSMTSDGCTAVSGTEDGTVRVWGAASGRQLATLESHTATVPSAQFSPDGTRVVTASDDKTARVWDVSLETRSPTESAALVRCRVPWRLDEGRLLPATPDPTACLSRSATQ